MQSPVTPEPARGLLSVVIPAYNAADTITACIESIVGTKHRPLEIIVADDASTDETPALVEAAAARHPGVVRLVRLGDNGGPARARNVGAEQARGDLLMFVDSDTRMMPDTIDAFLRRIPEADAVSGIYDEHPTNDTASARYQAIVKYYFFARGGVHPYECFNGAIAGIRTPVFREHGGYDPSLSWGMDYENEELGLRLIKKHRLLVDPDVRVRHRFPSFGRLVNLTFRRASLRVELFFGSQTKFESVGPLRPESALATLAPAPALALLPLAWYVPFGWVPSLLCLLFYLYGCGGLLAFVARRQPDFFPTFLAMHLFFSQVLAVASFHGLFRYLGKRRILRQQ